MITNQSMTNTHQYIYLTEWPDFAYLPPRVPERPLDGSPGAKGRFIVDNIAVKKRNRSPLDEA